MTSSPVVVLALQGKGAIEVSRKMMGATFGFKAEPGTIRGDYGVSSSFNLIHGSDSPEAAKAELALWFKPDELLTYDLANRVWTYDFSKGSPE
jgi:nucleoside-diphosphate kinase